MGIGFEMEFKFPDWAAKINQAQDEINLFIAAMMQTNRGELFDSEGAANGHDKWAPLAFRRGQILSNRGTLRQSLAPSNPQGRAGSDGIVRFAGEVITIGTKLAYARMMNDGTAKMPGGVLRPVNGKALKIPLPGGENATAGAKSLKKGSSKIGNSNFIFRKSVKIPGRPFDTWTKEDEDEMSAALTNKLVDILNR